MTPETLPKFWKSIGKAYKQIEIIEVEKLFLEVEDSIKGFEKKYGEHAVLNIRIKIEKIRKRINQKVKDLLP